MAQIKIAEYTFDSSVGDCLPTLTPNTITMTQKDTVSGTTTNRTVYIDDSAMPTKISFKSSKSLLTIAYLKIDSNITSLSESFRECTRLTEINVNNWDTSNVTSMWCAFYQCGITSLEGFSNLNVSKVDSFESTFNDCPNLTGVIDLSSWSPVGVTTMKSMFANTVNVTEVNLSGWNVPLLTTTNNMFYGDSYRLVKYKKIIMRNWTTNTLLDFANTFFGCRRLIEVDFTGSNISVRDMYRTFAGTHSLSEIIGMDRINTSNCVSFNSTFSETGKEYIDITSWDLSSSTNFQQMFYNCANLIEVKMNIDRDKCKPTNINSMFHNCPKLERIIGIENLNVSQVTNIGGIFRYDTSLKELDLSGWETNSSIITNTTTVFTNFNSTQTIYYDPLLWDLGKLDGTGANWVVKITRNNGYWLDMSTITEDTTITLVNENNLPTEEILTDWGDGTQDSNLTHTYSTAGEYVVVSNLQNAKASGNLKDYITKMVVYYASTPAGLCFNYNKITEVTLTNNWAEKTIEKYGQKVSTTQMFRNCPLLELPNLEPIKQFKPTYCVAMFYNCQKFTSIDLTGWDLSNCTSMSQMFTGCSNLTEIRGIDNLDVSKTTGFDNLFLNCSSLTSLDLSSWDVSQCTNMANMFDGCGKLTKLKLMKSELNNITNVSSMFRKCSSLTSIDLSSLNLNKATTTQYMFMDCTSLTDIKFNDSSFSNVTNCIDMFSSCMVLTNIDLSSIHITKNITMNHMFNNCPKLQSIKMFNCDGNVETIHYAFDGCKELKTLDLSNLTITPNTSVAGIFWGCKELEMVDLSNIRDIGNSDNIFTECPKLTTLGLLYSTSNTINTLASKMTSTEQKTIYYYDADPTQLAPVEGVTFKKYVTPTAIQLPPHIQLHSLPDGTRDEMDIKTGILTRKTYRVKITGSNSNISYELRDVNVQGNITMQCRINNVPKRKFTQYITKTYCDFIIPFVGNVGFSEGAKGIVGCGWYGATNMPNVFCIRMPISYLKELTLEAFKEFLNKNPINIVYELETPTTEQLILNYNNSCDYGRILPTGMTDKYSIVDSMYTQTMTSILLDGAIPWDATEDMSNVVKFTATGTTVGVEELNMLGAGGLYCDNDLFPNINDDSDVEHCRVDEQGNKFYFYVSKDRLMSPDLIGWQIWLQSNPFNLIYELKEHLIYNKPYEELDPEQARWEVMDCMRDGEIKYRSNSPDNITIYPTLEYVAPSINNFEVPLLEPNTKYTIYAEGINTNDIINLGGNDINFNNGTVFTSGDNQWLRIDNNDSFYNMVITKGDTTGEVVPYFEGMTSVENPKVQCGESTVSYTDLKLRSLPNGVKDTINVVTGEYVQRIGEREYQDGDITNENVLTDGINTAYELAEPVTTKLDPQTLLAYTDGTINLSSDTGLLPTTHYTVPSTNTFHLPSMKTGTRYTLKYPSASGTMAIGDIVYNISSDSMLFTTPLTITGDKSAIVFSDSNPENVILIEGAYNTREVPYFTGVKSVKNPNITVIDQLSTESNTYSCATDVELRGLPNGVADSLDIVKGKLTRVVGIRNYQEGDENLANVWTDGYETVYALSSPVVANIRFETPYVTTNCLIKLISEDLIPQLNYRAKSPNSFPLDLLQPNSTYTLYADTLVDGTYTLGGTHTDIFTGTHTIVLGNITDNLLTFNGDLGLNNVMLIKGNSLKTTLPKYFKGLKSVTDAQFLINGMDGEINEVFMDEGVVLRDCNGVKDVIDLTTCTLTKRTGEIVLNGSENWIVDTAQQVHDDYMLFRLVVAGLVYSNPANGRATLCDHFKHEYQLDTLHNKEGIYTIANAIRLCVKKTTIGGDTVNALKTWLAQNPTTVIYMLANPIEVPLENVWTITPPTSYDNQTEISTVVSSDSLKPMLSVTVATTTLEQIVSDLEAQNAQLEEENLTTMMALTEVYEMFASPVATMSLDSGVSTYSARQLRGITVSPIGLVYVNLIRKGYKTIEDVPYSLQAEVDFVLRGME